MAVGIGKLESELYELAKEFPHLRPCGSSPKRFTTYCPIHGKDKASDVKWRFEGDELVITCEVCGPLTLDQIRNPKPVVSEVKPSVTTVELPIESITVDTRAQSRSGIDVDLVSEYADAMREGAIFPPMTVFHDGTTHWLSEGFHRFFAYAKIEVTHCSCVVKQGGLREAILLSAGSNAEHDRSGKRRSNADKRRSVELLLKDEDWRSWSDREIGKQCSVSHEFVRQLRYDLQSNEGAICQPLTDTASIQEPEEVVPKATNEVRTATRGGTTYTLKTGNIGKPKKVVNPIDSAIKLAVSKVFDEMDGELSDEKGIDLAVSHILSGLDKSDQTKITDESEFITISNGILNDVIELIKTHNIPNEYHAELIEAAKGWAVNSDASNREGTSVAVKGFAWWDERSGALAKRRIEVGEKAKNDKLLNKFGSSPVETTTFNFVEKLKDANAAINDLLRCADHFDSFDLAKLEKLHNALAEIQQAHNKGIDEIQSRIDVLLLPVEKDITPQFGDSLPICISLE